MPTDRTIAEIDTGDTAWMLTATALVLLMTLGARPLLRGPGAREEHPEHVHDVHRRARRRDVTWALVGYSLAFGDGSGVIGSFDYAFLNDVGFEPRERQTIPHLVFFAFQGDVLHHHRGAGLRRGGRADAVPRRSWSSPRCGRSLVYPVLAHWVFGGGWLQRGRHARLRGRRRRSRWAPGSRRSRRRSSSARARTTGARRSSPTTRSTCCSAPACCGSAGSGSTAAAASAPARRERPRVHEHAAHPGVHACSSGSLLDAIRGAPDHGGRRRDGDHRRLRRDHPGGRLHQPGLGDGARSPRRASVLRGDRAAGRGPASTRRSTSSPPTASPASRGSCSSGSSRRLDWNGISDGLVYGGSSLLGDQALAALVAPLYAFGATFVLLNVMALVDCRCGRRARRGARPGRRAPRRGGLRHRRGRDPGHAGDGESRTGGHGETRVATERGSRVARPIAGRFRPCPLSASR